MGGHYGILLGDKIDKVKPGTARRDREGNFK
jgi:hypothetical protein